MRIIVDADACPKAALQACMRLGRKYGIPVWTVASFNHNIQSDHHVTVGSGSQEADLKVVNLAEKGDIAVTQDWSLAGGTLKDVRFIPPHPEDMIEAMSDLERFMNSGD